MRAPRLLLGIGTLGLVAACVGDDAEPRSPSGAASSIGVAAAEPDPDASTGAITVVGEGRATAVPDIARVVVGVEVTRDDVQDAFDDAADAMAAMLDDLQAEGVEQADIRTEELSVR